MNVSTETQLIHKLERLLRTLDQPIANDLTLLRIMPDPDECLQLMETIRLYYIKYYVTKMKALHPRTHRRIIKLINTLWDIYATGTQPENYDNLGLSQGMFV